MYNPEEFWDSLFRWVSLWKPEGIQEWGIYQISVKLKKNKELPIRGSNISTFFGFPKYRRSAILSYLNNDSPQIENRPNKKIKVKK
jgi:hypothetical protein